MMNQPFALPGAILFIVALAAMTPFAARAEPLILDASAPMTAPKSDGFKLGNPRSLDGHQIAVTSQSLLRDGKPWLPVMGEFHYARYPASEWRDELLKIKAGGISIVATYVFWIHHEEEEGVWNWSGDRSLRDFILTCKEVGLPVIVRAGPWCHGEVRNGGLPEWTIPMGRALRTQDAAFLKKVKVLYEQIAGQLRGLQWKDGGPVIGMQFDNEYGGNAAYLLDLKKIAIDAGIDLPIYTRTGWPNLRTPMPTGELLPLYGAYSEGFWNRDAAVMPGKYWFAFVFSTIRSDAAIGTDVLGEREQRDEADASQYPFLSCELGGGMMTSYHRRILIDPRDVESVALVKTGSGSNLPGYYMYHGGTNPQGKLTTLMETQSAKYTNSNDMPVKTYDFQAPLGEFGQVRPHYHGLRRLHLMLNDWGEKLATMPAKVPNVQQKKNDAETVRWAVRTDGKSGFLFVSNYQRLLPMPEKNSVQFQVRLAGGVVTMPDQPFTIPADSYFAWPINLDLGGVTLQYATAQPICQIEQQGTNYVFFAQTPNIPADFAVDGTTHRLSTSKDGWSAPLPVGTSRPIRTSIVLLDDATSRAIWKGEVGGRQRVFISRGSLLMDGNRLRVQAENSNDLAVSMFDAGEFKPMKFEPPAPREAQAVAAEPMRPAGIARQVKNGSQRVPEAPSDNEFDQAAVWSIKLPATLDLRANLLLRIHYTGDVARLYLDGKLINDNFYNGTTFDLGLKRFDPDIRTKELVLKILPLRKDSPIYLARQAMPDFSGEESAVKLSSVELIERHEVSIPFN